jgi:hypothetical protein
MNQEAQRIAIGEACGWKDFVGSSRIINNYSGTSPSGKTAWLPDYCNDLNAMHEAEKILLRLGKEVAYIQNLENKSRILEQADWWIIAHATASQRSEAFLRALNLWVEDSQITTNSNAPKDVGGHNCK